MNLSHGFRIVQKTFQKIAELKRVVPVSGGGKKPFQKTAGASAGDHGRKNAVRFFPDAFHSRVREKRAEPDILHEWKHPAAFPSFRTERSAGKFFLPGKNGEFARRDALRQRLHLRKMRIVRTGDGKSIWNNSLSGLHFFPFRLFLIKFTA